MPPTPIETEIQSISVQCTLQAANQSPAHTPHSF